MKKLLIYLTFMLTPVVLLYIVVLHVQIQRYSQLEQPENVDYLIVLGAKVTGTVPSLSLQYRIDAAATYLKENSQTIVIASGGQGPGENVTEAEAIKEGLIAQGIAEERIRKEDQSTTTYENLCFSKSFLPEQSANGMIVTNHYHVFRAVSIAKDQNLDVSGLPAKTPFISLPKSYIREYLAITKYYLTKRLNIQRLEG